MDSLGIHRDWLWDGTSGRAYGSWCPVSWLLSTLAVDAKERGHQTYVLPTHTTSEWSLQKFNFESGQVSNLTAYLQATQGQKDMLKAISGIRSAMRN